MPLTIYGHPFSSHCWKVYIALRERGLTWQDCTVDPAHPNHQSIVQDAAPTGQFPVLDHDGRRVVESAVIVEYLDRLGSAPPMIPTDPDAALEARQMDGICDDYVNAPVGRIVLNAMRDKADQDPSVEPDTRARMQQAYRWLDRHLAATGDPADRPFGLADCAAAPALFYAHWIEPIPQDLSALRRWRASLLRRPSVAETIEAGRYFRPFFPVPTTVDPDAP